jgi:imidazolonepropionase
VSFLIQNARVVLGDGRTPGFVADLRVAGEQIAQLGAALSPEPGEAVLDAAGRVLLPGFVDAHTHALFAGDRLDEFELKLRGQSYLEILAAGGGILSTVRAVRAASVDELVRGLEQRLGVFLAQGTTSLEIKSGYGLRTEDELKMLRAIARAAQGFCGSIVPTALLGHALDPDEPHFVDRVVNETLPAVHAEFPGITIDAYCERGAFGVADCKRLFERALTLGHPVRLHVDQFSELGGLELALALGARSVDHLEATSPAELRELAASQSFAVLLPASGFHTDERYADARTLLDLGGRVVLASNFNPGSSPCSSLPLVIALAVRKLRMTALEAIHACTSQAAALLGFADRGTLRAGARADLVLLRHTDERQLAFELGGNPVESVYVAGRRVTRAT